MKSIRPLGSSTALSLASDEELPEQLVMAGITLAVSAAIFTYHKYEEYQEKKHRKKIEVINLLHKKYLEKIFVTDYGVIKGFPPIFKISKENNGFIESMHMTAEQIDEIGKDIPHGYDVALSVYRQNILNAIKKLKSYYFDVLKNPHTDITSGVVSYLLFMIETKCLNFQGYVYDIAYLDAITQFIGGFASIKNRKKSVHFSRLSPVYTYLINAKQSLERHKESLTLKDTIGEIYDICNIDADKLIRCFAKLICKNDNWHLIDTVTLDEIEKGFLSKEYIRKEIFNGFIISNDNEVKIPDSPFKYWLAKLAKYYLQSIDYNQSQTTKDIFSPEKEFHTPNEKDKNFYDQILEIEKSFKKSQNFITTTVPKKPKKYRGITDFEPIKEPKLLLSRTQSIFNIATLIHRLISLQYLCSHLLKSIKQLGEIYVQKPENFKQIFILFDGLVNTIKENAQNIKKDIVKIEIETGNALQLEQDQRLKKEFKETLQSLQIKIARLGKIISDFRIKYKAIPDQLDQEMHMVKHEMFKVANAINNIYQITENELNQASMTQTSCKDPNKLNMNLSPPLHLNVHNLSTQSQSLLNFKEKKLNTSIQNNYTMLMQLHEKIVSLQENNTQSTWHKEEINVYIKIWHALFACHNKSESILKEQKKATNRIAKASHFIALINQILFKFIDFLNIDSKNRYQKVKEFYKQIETILSDPNNDFLDKKYHQFNKLKLNTFRKNTFNTGSRKQVNNLNNACKKLTGIGLNNN